MYFYAEEGGTPIVTPYMGAHWRHLTNTISHLNYLLRRRCGLMSNYFDHLLLLLLFADLGQISVRQCTLGILFLAKFCPDRYTLSPLRRKNWHKVALFDQILNLRAPVQPP